MGAAHSWIVGPFRQDRDAAVGEKGEPTFQVDCHRNHRGPYTGSGELVRAIVPGAFERAPALVLRHALTLLSISPEMRDLVPVSDELARSFAFSREGNSRFFTLRLAHGLTAFFLEYFAEIDASPSRIRFENVHAADPLDQEFLAVLLRRADSAKVEVVVGTCSEEVNEPLLGALRAHARVTKVEPAASPPADHLDRLVRQASASLRHAWAEQYVASDCTADDPVAERAYELLDPALRRKLHLDRAASLSATGSRSLALGALPLHSERAGLGVEPFATASAYCMRMAYYEASLDLARRGCRAMGDDQGGAHPELGRNIVFSLLLLDRLGEVEDYCGSIDSRTESPALRSHCAYAMAILNARLYPAEKRDYEAARAWIQKAIALAELVPDSETKVVNIVFLRNTLALVEMRTGHPDEALRLLSAGLARLEAEAPSKYPMECIILLHNRARIHLVLGQPERALDDYTTLLRHEPTNSEAHLDRGILLQRMGRLEEAVLDYDAAIAWSPPYDEAYYNRAQTLLALGRKEQALADYGCVITLEPGHVGALVNRAGILYSRGELAAARQDVERILAQSPRHAKALCLLGLLEMAERRPDQAKRAFDLALESDGSETTAWINRATLLFERGDAEAALRDLDRAVALSGDATAFSNRARIMHSQRRWEEAIADYDRAIELSRGEAGDLPRLLALCQRALRVGQGGALELDAGEVTVSPTPMTRRE
jgi:tetratricopeptide (TPR) repeat protein